MPKVYFFNTISPHSIGEIFEIPEISALVSPGDLTAIKLHFGERGNTGYVKPEFVKPVVEKIKKLKAKPFLTDANTIYIGERAEAVSHISLAYGHGFGPAIGCPIIIADGLKGNSYVEVDITSGLNIKPRIFKKVKIANAIFYSDSIVCMSHVKGHMLTGMGGSLKNMGMGCASRAGKYEQHNTILPTVSTENCISCGACVKWCSGKALAISDKKSKVQFDPKKCTGCGECFLVCKHEVFDMPWSESSGSLQERMVEYCSGAVKGKKIIYINILNNLTRNCDCMARGEQSLTKDVGILASTDIVAVDQASLDLINKSHGSDFFKSIWPAIDYNVQLKYAEELGIGNRKYELIDVLVL